MNWIVSKNKSSKISRFPNSKNDSNCPRLLLSAENVGRGADLLWPSLPWHSFLVPRIQTSKSCVNPRTKWRNWRNLCAPKLAKSNDPCKAHPWCCRMTPNDQASHWFHQAACSAKTSTSWITMEPKSSRSIAKHPLCNHFFHCMSWCLFDARYPFSRNVFGRT